jgi:hypothetical protein
MAEQPNTPITRYDLSCPDEGLQEILQTIVCCTDCGFDFFLDEEENDLVIKNKDEEYRVDVSKYLDDTRVVDFKLENKKLILKQSNNVNFEIPLVDILNQSIYKGSFTTSSPGIQTEIIINHNLGFIPMFYSIQNNTKDAQGYTHVTATASNFKIWYEIAPKVGANNLQYNWIVII